MSTKCCDYEKTTEDINKRLDIKQLIEIQGELNSLFLSGWDNVLTPCDFQTSMIDKLNDVLNLNISWDYKEDPVDPTLFDLFNVKSEMVDVSSDYISMMVMWNSASTSHFDHCEDTGLYDQFDAMYVGTDKGRSFTGIGFLSSNALIHCKFMDLVIELMKNQEDIYLHIDSLDKLVSSSGMSSIEFSGIFAAKEAIIKFKQSDDYQDGTYVDVSDGLTDNERLKPLIEDFVSTSSITLDDLRQNVEDAFFELA